MAVAVGGHAYRAGIGGAWRAMARRTVWVGLVALVALPSAAQAYIDPGAGPLLWQLLLAGLAGLVYQVTRWWSAFRHRTRREPTDPE